MAIIGHIFGILFLIFGAVLLVGIIHYVINFDFDAPIFKIDVTISDKTDDKN